MNMTHSIRTKYVGALLFCGAMLAMPSLPGRAALAQQRPLSDAAATPHRSRLILKDGSYQIVMSYRVNGDRVIFVSAERGGAEEEIPVSLVDFDATHRWEQQHAAGSKGTDAKQTQAPEPVIDPELRKDEEERRALTPEIAPDLRLPEQDSVLALDTFQGTPELVPLTQSAGDLNHVTSHSVLRSMINPMASSHQIVQLHGETAYVQLHVNTPVLYLRIGDESGVRTGGEPLTVDTHGASGVKEDAGAGTESRYVIVRTDVRQDARIVASFNVSVRGEVRQQEDLVETSTELLPGGHWMKLTPLRPLTFGEYALIEIISPKEVNLGVWDFGVHPTAPENRDVLKPEPKRPLVLERRKPD